MRLNEQAFKSWLALLCGLVLALGLAACSGNDDDDVTNDDDDTTCNCNADQICQNNVCVPKPANDDDDDDDDITDDDDDACEDGQSTETDCTDKINVVGDTNCGGDDAAPTGGTVTVTGVVEDFQAGTPVGGAVMEIPDLGITTTTKPDGTFTLTGLPGNERFNMKISATGYRETWQYEVWAKAADYDDDFVIVSNSTYNLVPGLWGVAPKPEDCVIAGSVSDCQGDSLAGYGVTAHSAGCDEDTAVKWFKGEFPSAAQCPASDDGLYGVVNVAPPEVTIDVVGAGGTVLKSAGPVPCVAGAIGVFNISLAPED